MSAAIIPETCQFASKIGAYPVISFPWPSGIVDRSDMDRLLGLGDRRRIIGEDIKIGQVELIVDPRQFFLGEIDFGCCADDGRFQAGAEPSTISPYQL